MKNNWTIREAVGLFCLWAAIVAVVVASAGAIDFAEAFWRYLSQILNIRGHALAGEVVSPRFFLGSALAGGLCRGDEMFAGGFKAVRDRRFQWASEDGERNADQLLKAPVRIQSARCALHSRARS